MQLVVVAFHINQGVCLSNMLWMCQPQQSILWSLTIIPCNIYEAASLLKKLLFACACRWRLTLQYVQETVYEAHCELVLGVFVLQ